MHPTQRRREPFVGKPAHQPGRGGRPRGGPERLDQQHFEQASQHHLAAGPVGSGFLVQQLNQRREPALAAHDHPFGQQRDQQRRVV